MLGKGFENLLFLHHSKDVKSVSYITSAAAPLLTKVTERWFKFTRELRGQTSASDGGTRAVSSALTAFPAFCSSAAPHLHTQMWDCDWDCPG